MSSVLIVDDNPSDRILFKTILTRAGYQVHEVARGNEAIAKIRETRPHVVVLDVNLPDTDGHSICRAIKGDPDTSGIPVLMLTIRDHDEDVLAGLEAGADDYVAKDADGAIVLARIKRLIQFRQLASVAVLNEQLVQIGRLLAGIVHEIRGPLSVIRASAEMLRIQMKSDEATHQWIDPILRNTRLLQIRLEHLMSAVRGGPAVLDFQDLNPLVEESVELFLKGIDPRGTPLLIERRFAEGLPPVRVDAGRCIQVLLSLLGNAQEAMQGANGGGKVTVTTTKAHDPSNVDWVTIELRDEGPGIPESYLGRIFEPFFTTKATGTGYGLYLASELLKEQGGKLTVENCKPSGARFTVWFPCILAEPHPRSVAPYVEAPGRS